MAKFTKAEEPSVYLNYRCGSCFFFFTKSDSNNPSDGFCHGFPPNMKSTGFEWTRTASNEFGCSLFKKRG